MPNRPDKTNPKGIRKPGDIKNTTGIPVPADMTNLPV